MAIRKAILKESAKKKAEELKLEIMQKVSMKANWKDRCPTCKGKVTLEWESPDGTAKAYRCQKGHLKRGQRVHPVWIVRT